ncbi:RBR-type E3 ubiquitin transferase, partial [Favolaschia claudopus]
MADEILSEILIAQLLEEDLRAVESAKEAERLQLDQVFAVSARASGRIPKFSASAKSVIQNDADFVFFGVVALAFLAADARISSDAAFAQRVQASTIADLQYAQQVAAAEKKFMLDAEFARRLQAVDDEGQDTDQVQDAESLLGQDVVDHIMASDLNEKGKGKIDSSLDNKHFSVKQEQHGFEMSRGKGKRPEFDEGMNFRQKRLRMVSELQIKQEEAEPAIYATCGICMDAFQPTFSPYTASLSANSSSRLQFGLRLPCPQQHAYCVGCLTTYIESKLDPDGKGAGSSGIIVFPIRCPECPITDFMDGIPDDIAARVMGPEKMVLWDHQKLLNSIPHLYCPNPKCSAIVQTPEETDNPQAVCPSCQLLLCVPCRVAWHNGISCEQYQALPPDERSLEDRLLHELAKAKRWRRCPNCSVCGTHFCFKCGSLATTKGQCQRVPPCDLWDEEMLLEERERDRELAANAIPPVHPPPAYNPAPAPYIPQPAVIRRAAGSLDWIDDPNIVCSRHPFTTDMIRNLVCGYCNVRLNSLADLRFHLSHVRHHPVFFCCGRFFRREQDYDRHVEALSRSRGRHFHPM